MADNRKRAFGIFAEALNEHLHAHNDRFQACRAKCESPIEELFLAGLFAASLRHGDVIDFREGGPLDFMRSTRPAACYQQVRIGRYRVDFLILKGTGEQIVVECDGQDFHVFDEHVSRNRERDAHLTKTGYTMLRFTGSELHRDAYACAFEVLREAVLVNTGLSTDEAGGR